MGGRIGDKRKTGTEVERRRERIKEIIWSYVISVILTDHN